MILQLRDERGRPGGVRFDIDPKDGSRRGRPRIRCPRCSWEPERKSLWMCTCLHIWNTFDTGGKCPGCGKQWEDTMCLHCHQWSKHRDWYGAEDE